MGLHTVKFMEKCIKGTELMGVYYFVVAAAIAALGISLLFKMNVDKVKADPEQIGIAQRNFFIGVMGIEAMPIILLILGIVTAEPVQSVEELYLPAILIVMFLAFAIFFILLQRSVGVSDDSKAAVNTFSVIALALASSIPIIALVFLFILM